MNWSYRWDLAGWDMGTSVVVNPDGNAWFLCEGGVNGSFLLEIAPDGTQVAQHRLFSDSSIEANSLIYHQGALYITGESTAASADWQVCAPTMVGQSGSMEDATGTWVNVTEPLVAMEYTWITPEGVVDDGNGTSEFFLSSTELPLPAAE
ncbi:hypothetical protein JW859_13290 [bacterium]|nr:hypothetical protein [bacterium]